MAEVRQLNAKPMDLAMKLSVRNETYEQFPVRDAFQSRYDNVCAGEKKRKLKVTGGANDGSVRAQILSGVPISFLEEQKYEGVTSIDELEEITNYFIEHFIQGCGCLKTK